MSSKQYQLRYLPIFYDDLSNAVEYISEFLKNPKAAENLIDKVETAILKRSNYAESTMEVRRFLYKGQNKDNIL